MTVKMILKSTCLMYAAMWVAGCASTNGSGSVQMNQQAQSACLAATGRGELVMLDVPAGSSAISNQLAAASLRVGGGSSSVDALVDLLQKPLRGAVLLVGRSQALTAATAEVTLRQLAKSGKKAAAPLCVAVSGQAGADLATVAQGAGVRLSLVP